MIYTAGMAKTKTRKITIQGNTIEVCSNCYQRLRREGKLIPRPYQRKPENPADPAQT